MLEFVYMMDFAAEGSFDEAERIMKEEQEWFNAEMRHILEYIYELGLTEEYIERNYDTDAVYKLVLAALHS